MRFKAISGKTFGRLIALWPVGTDRHGKLWACQCIEGNVVIVRSCYIISGSIKSCGCLRRENIKKIASLGGKSGGRNLGMPRELRMWQTREYWSYRMALNRCTNRNSPDWKNYGGRGIEFRFVNFGEFYRAIGPRPKGLVLDRIDNDGHYEPGNVRWTTWKISANNKRKRSRVA